MINTTWAQHRADFPQILHHLGRAVHWNAWTSTTQSTPTPGPTPTVLIDRYWFGMRSIGNCIGCSGTRLLLKLLLIYGSVFVSSFLTLPPSMHVNLLTGNLFPCLLPCSGLLLSQGLIHSTWRYSGYTAKRLLQQTLLHKPLPFYGFVFLHYFF